MTIAVQGLITAKLDPVLVELEGHVQLGRVARRTATVGRDLNSAQQLLLQLLPLLQLLLPRLVRLRHLQFPVRINGISVLAKDGEARNVAMLLLFALTIVFGTLSVSESTTSLV